MDLLRRTLSEANSSLGAISQEGFADNMLVRMRQFFDRSEREIGQEHVDARKLTARIDKLLEQAKHKTELKEDSLPLKLSAWAKWLVIDDEVVGDPDALVKELERLRGLLHLFNSAWLDSYTQTLHALAEKVVKPAVQDPTAALQAAKPILLGYYPKAFDVIMKRHEKVENHGTVRDVPSSEKYLGMGAVHKVPAWWWPEEVSRVEISEEGYKRTEPKSAEIIPFSPGQVIRVLNGVKALIAEAEKGDGKAAGTAQSALIDALETYEQKTGIDHGHHTEGSDKEQRQIWSMGYTVMSDHILISDLLLQLDHICQVIVKLCDGSLYRSK